MRLAAVAAAALTLALPAAAHASDLVRPDPLDVAPAGHRLTGEQAERIANRSPKVAEARRRHPGSFANVFLKGDSRWQVSYYGKGTPAEEFAQVYVDDTSGRVTEVWTGHQVAWTMARGYEGAFGRKVTALWLWIPLTLLFVAPFVDWRRPLRLRHVDLLALTGFGVSLAFFNEGDIGMSVPLAYPPLLYLLGRALWLGLGRGNRTRRQPGPDRLLPLVPVSWLAIALIFLVGFRVGLNVTNANAIDVGYASVIGADRIADGRELWGTFPAEIEHGDTYGPLTYAAYVPFEQIWPWSGSWDELAAAHAAAVTFDLLCLVLIFLIGRRIRGVPLGIVLAYAWAAYPFNLYALSSNVNDGLVAALVLAAILAAASPAGRGALVGLAGTAKFAPLALAPLFATHSRGAGRFAVGLAAAVAVGLTLVLGYGDLSSFYDRTIGFQASRESPFSVWGLYGWDTARTVVQLAAVALALVVAVVPRRRDVVGLCALTSAVLIALQLGVTHWFYLYIVWFSGPLLVALLADQGSRTWSMETARSGSDEQLTSTALSHGSSSLVSNRTDMWVRIDSIACSLRTPSTLPRAPVMPTSLM